MDNERYRNLMWHLLYVESLLENVSDATWLCASVPFANQKYVPIFRSAYDHRFHVPMLNVRIVIRLNVTGLCGF